ncbi:HDOD domain-containing protein [Motilimonas pumila]|uniref:HDOD domain-containing protein n=1 Tax=Motilimonas pumila TaxID=2303987 RepID=A0A418YHB5_9GAMM|nr:HDOD domain-containing protein [Motilimonas pumila]RJG49434.1 HDOD domain-containing protein [Motilimonas pumila]
MDLNAVFSNLKQLPVIPTLLAELMESFGDEDARIDVLAKKIAMDQSLSAKVIKMANSAAYRRGKEVSSIEQAVIRLGFNTMRSIVIASGIGSAFPNTPGFDKNQFWADTFKVATISKALAKHTKIEPETAFTCAMMHNIGEVLLQSSLPEEMALVAMAMENGSSRVEAQRETLGFDYSQVGVELARRWNFSETFINAIEQQLDPLSFEDVSGAAILIRLSVFVNFAWNAGVPAQAIIGRFPKALAQHLDINPESLAGQLDDLQTQGNELAMSLV